MYIYKYIIYTRKLFPETNDLGTFLHEWYE